MKKRVFWHLIIISVLAFTLSLIFIVLSSQDINISDGLVIEEEQAQMAHVSFIIGIVIGLIFSLFQPILTIGFISLLVWLFLLIKDSNIKYSEIFISGIKPYYIVLIGQAITLFVLIPSNLYVITTNNIHALVYTAIYLFIWWRGTNSDFPHGKGTISFAFLGTSLILSLLVILGRTLS